MGECHMSTVGVSIVEQQVKELDAIAKQTNQDLNTVAGTERMSKWKTRTVALLTQHVGQKEAEEFARKQTGPSFTNDLVEEFNDDVDCFRTYLNALAKRLRATPPAPAG